MCPQKQNRFSAVRAFSDRLIAVKIPRLSPVTALGIAPMFKILNNTEAFAQILLRK
jgi:hypothetical protein